VGHFGTPDPLAARRAKTRCRVDGQPIAQCLQHGSKQTESAVLVVPSQACVEVVYPFVSKVNGLLDAFQTKGTH
jgi:hypothetical protein